MSVGLSNFGHLAYQPQGEESSPLNIVQMGRFDTKVATFYQASSKSSLPLRFIGGSADASPISGVDQGVVVFVAGTSDVHVMDASSSELLWSAALPQEVANNAKAVNGLQVEVCSPDYLVLWSTAIPWACWTAMSRKASVRAARAEEGEDLDSEAGASDDDEENGAPNHTNGHSNGTTGLPEKKATSVTSKETMSSCVPVPLPAVEKKGAATTIEAILPVEEEESRVSFVLVSSKGLHHAFTQERLSNAAVVFIQSGQVTVGENSPPVAALSRVSNHYIQVNPEEFSSTSALYTSRLPGSSSGAAWVVTATIEANGESVSVTMIPVQGLEQGGIITRAAAINSQCWVLIGATTNQKKAEAGATGGKKSRNSQQAAKESTTASSTSSSPFIASLAVDTDSGSASATAFPLVEPIAACAYDETCEGVRLVKFSTDDTSALEATVVPFPEREAIVLDTVELLLQGVGLEENQWEPLQSTTSRVDKKIATTSSSAYNQKDELLFHYLAPTANSKNNLSVLAVSAPQPQHTKRGTEGKTQLAHLVAGGAASADIFTYTWHPNSIRNALRLAGSEKCLKLLRVVTSGLQGEQETHLSPLQLRTVGMSLAMHIVTLSRPLGLVIPAHDVEILYLVNSHSRSLAPNLVSAASRLDALLAFVAEQEANEKSVFGAAGQVYSAPASLKMKKYAYGNNAAAVVASLKSRLPSNLQATPQALAGQRSVQPTRNEDASTSSPFLQYEAGAVLLAK